MNGIEYFFNFFEFPFPDFFVGGILFFAVCSFLGFLMFWRPNL